MNSRFRTHTRRSHQQGSETDWVSSPNTTVTSSLGQDTQGQDGLQEGRHPKTGHGSTDVMLARQGALCCASTVCLGAGGGWSKFCEAQMERPSAETTVSGSVFAIQPPLDLLCTGPPWGCRDEHRILLY